MNTEQMNRVNLLILVNLVNLAILVNLVTLVIQAAGPKGQQLEVGPVV